MLNYLSSGNLNYRKIAILILLSITALGCSTKSPAPFVTRAQVMPNAHKVYSGESLYSIAWRYGLDYLTLAKINNIEPPYHIHPGQIIKLDANKNASLMSLNDFTNSFKASTAAEPKNVSPPPKKIESYQPSKNWLWPTDGDVTKFFSSSESHKGIDISGTLGQPIRSVANGEVVYAGSGIIGYGKLILIKHPPNFLSAYAHNHTLLVREGDSVKQGDVVARMGKTDAKHVHLHFELRKQGKPVDPMKYLK